MYIFLNFPAPPHLIEKPEDVQKPIDDPLVWECKATGKPKPSYRWMKNGDNLEPVEVRHALYNARLSSVAQVGSKTVATQILIGYLMLLSPCTVMRSPVSKLCYYLVKLFYQISVQLWSIL